MSEYIWPCLPVTVSPRSSFFARLDQDPAWIAEKKLNGWRLEIVKEGRNLILWNRHKRLIEDPLPEIRKQLLAMMPNDTILDGELLFTRRVKGTPESVYLFDIIKYKGTLVNELTLRERRIFLEKSAKPSEQVVMSQWVQVGKKKLYLDAEHEDSDILEGIVLKKLDSLYPISLTKSRENPFWLKVKFPAKHLRTGGRA